MSMMLKNSIRLSGVIVVLVLYGLAIVWALSVAAPMVVVFLGYCLICILIASAAYRRDSRDLDDEVIEFRYQNPLARLGTVIADPQYVFAHSEDLLDEIRARLTKLLDSELGLQAPIAYEVIDGDRHLVEAERREFRGSSFPPTARGTEVHILFGVARHKRIHSIQWWLLLRGYLSRQAAFFFHAFAPLTVPFWLVPYLRGDIHHGQSFREIYGASFNTDDVVTLVRMAQRAIVDGLVAYLDEKGVDTSDLKEQRAQMINVTISGGRVKVGNIVQGRLQIGQTKGGQHG